VTHKPKVTDGLTRRPTHPGAILREDDEGERISLETARWLIGQGRGQDVNAFIEQLIKDQHYADPRIVEAKAVTVEPEPPLESARATPIDYTNA
jgi:hypothetical protein